MSGEAGQLQASIFHFIFRGGLQDFSFNGLQRQVYKTKKSKAGEDKDYFLYYFYLYTAFSCSCIYARINIYSQITIVSFFIFHLPFLFYCKFGIERVCVSHRNIVIVLRFQ